LVGTTPRGFILEGPLVEKDGMGFTFQVVGGSLACSPANLTLNVSCKVSQGRMKNDISLLPSTFAREKQCQPR
jgi:hypothetical protein